MEDGDTDPDLPSRVLHPASLAGWPGMGCEVGEGMLAVFLRCRIVCLAAGDCQVRLWQLCIYRWRGHPVSGFALVLVCTFSAPPPEP